MTTWMMAWAGCATEVEAVMLPNTAATATLPRRARRAASILIGYSRVAYQAVAIAHRA